MKLEIGGLFQQTKWNVTGLGNYSIYFSQRVICSPALKNPSSRWEWQITKGKRVHLHMNHFNQRCWHTSSTPLLLWECRERCHRRRPLKNREEGSLSKRRGGVGPEQEEEVSGGKKKRREGDTQSPWMSHSTHLSTSYRDIYAVQYSLPLLRPFPG